MPPVGVRGRVDAGGGGSGLRRATAVEDWEVLDLLTALVDKSLVVYEEEAEGQGTRYRLLETVRQYAGERLAGERGGGGAGRAASWCLALAEEAEPQIGA